MGKDHELLEAARHGNITVVEKILFQKSKRSGPLASLRRGPGANAQDTSGNSSLHHASLYGHTDIVRVLLAHDASPNLLDNRGSSPLHMAAWAGHQDIVKLLLTNAHRPANPNLQTIDNETPLHGAAQHGHTGALTTLLAHGADPNITNNRGETPLELAAQYGRLQVVQMLIRAHPELLLPFKMDACVDHSPLHLASRNGHKNVVEVLLAAGINVNLLTAAGTALHEAALCGKDNVVRSLLDMGADLDSTDCDGRTALDLLEQFPPHVTKGIVSVINNHRNSMAYDSESDDMRDLIQQTYNHAIGTPMSLDSSYDNNRGSSPNHLYSYHDITSPSSSMGSLGPPSPRPRASTADTSTPGFYVTMAPITGSKVSPTPPKKPPRRNLSVSPTHFHSSHTQMSTSVDSGTDEFNRSAPSRSAAYEYLYLARSGGRPAAAGGRPQHADSGHDDVPDDGRSSSLDQYIHMISPTHPQPSPRSIVTANYENTTLRSYNPNRKLRRNRDNYEQFNINRATITTREHSPNDSITTISSSPPPPSNHPTSPSHYRQPPTPEHPPPNALQAEKVIHDRIRPLSQVGEENIVENGTVCWVQK